MDNKQALSDNLKSWEDRADAHAGGSYGDLTNFMADPTAITGTVKRDLAVLAPYLPGNSVAGQRLLHLQCHIGTDTLSWWRLGAAGVHGLDFSPNSLKYAKNLAQQAGAQIKYIEADARYASAALSSKLGQFDVIVTSAGTITWLPNLKDWAQSIADLLAPNGVFMIRDNHPLLFALDNDGLAIKQDYFGGTEVDYEAETSYQVNDQNQEQGKLAHQHNHNWAHDFQEIVTVLRDAGLTIESLGEERTTDWKALPMLEYDPRKDEWKMPAKYPQIPLTFSIVARKA
ncbi:SAM-dependent methyltransferase [Ligilactobacillus salitolerans]|uniref:SAM-dependent methyltransferase n=1 Tax=Ligilactobacillus salitolerans TaxID=1808352 RepID=A0A401IVL3_9LACO|nr:class I SAM-dependent methyltransferase [Ligilactobacillus salitolerans]GBG95591.1 SAM-dependent methyltransferase [Ligilactobacillus salitolerans]